MESADTTTEVVQNGSQLIPTTMMTTWTYDALGRLTGEAVVEQLPASLGGANESYTDAYTYDLDSNRISKVHVGPGGTGANETITYTYDADDQLKTQASNINGTTTFTYDPNGSQLTSTLGSATTTYTYDVRNRLSVVQTSSKTTTYTYDDAGQRVVEKTGSTTSYSVIDTINPMGDAQPLEIKTSLTATPTATFIIGDRVLGQSVSGTTPMWIMTDAHGDTRELMQPGGGLVSGTFNYDAFGTSLFSSINPSTVDLFGGDAVFDPATQLYLHGDGVRASQGFRFIQADGQGYNDQYNPVTNNLYLLDGADAVNNHDCNGHDMSLGEQLSTTTTQASLMSILLPAAGLGLLAGGALFAALSGGGAGPTDPYWEPADDPFLSSSDSAELDERYYDTWIAGGHIAADDTISKTTLISTTALRHSPN